MKGWKEAILERIANVNMGQSPDSQFYNDNNIGIPFLQGCADFGNYYPHTNVCTTDIKKLSPENSILFSVRAPVGKINFSDKQYCIGRGLASIESKEISQLLLYYILLSKENELNCLSQGSTFASINSKQLKELSVFFPICDCEQRKIAEILSTIDKAIEQTETLIAKYKNIKKGLMHNLLTYGIDKEGNVRNPNTHTFVEKNGMVVPEEWEVRRVDELSNVTGGKRLPAGHDYSENRNGFKYLRVTDFYNKNVDYQNLENLEESTFNILERYEIFNKDLFISIAGSIGYVGVFKSDISDRIILTENALRINLFEVVVPEYLSFQINSEIVQKQIWSEIGTGGGVPKLAMHRVKSLLIPHPIINKEYNEQQKIIDVIDAKDKLIESEETNLAKLQKQKQGLMQDLLTGKVRVKI